MSPANHPVLARADGATLSTAEFLSTLRRECRLPGLVRQVLAEKLVLAAAAEAGIVVSEQELQQASNRWRRQAGLARAEATHGWLQAQGLTLREFEAALKDQLLIEKFRHHLVDCQGVSEFKANAAAYARARLSRLVVASEGEARELLYQIREEGAAFAELARQHSQDEATRARGGDLGIVMRCQLPTVIGEHVFPAEAGDVVGPVSTALGIALFHVQTILPPELDDLTRAVLREQIFARWMTEKMQAASIDLTVLEPCG